MSERRNNMKNSKNHARQMLKKTSKERNNKINQALKYWKKLIIKLKTKN